MKGLLFTLIAGFIDLLLLALTLNFLFKSFFCFQKKETVEIKEKKAMKIDVFSQEKNLVIDGIVSNDL